jgi:Tat protein secretion system quality control protein TatD with DNase activity
MVETDSPVYIRSQQRQSEPSDVLLTIRHLALLKGLSEEETAEATTANAETLFNDH